MMPINQIQAPINYLAASQVPDPSKSLMEGLQMGASIRKMREESEATDRAKAMQEQYAKDLQATLSAPTPQAFAAMSAKYPQQREAFKQSWEMLSKDQQDSEFLTGAQAFNAIRSGNTDAAKSLLEQRIVAAQNSGMSTQKMEAMRSALESNPESVQGQLGLVLSSVDPDRWAKFALAGNAMQKSDADLTEAQAKAKSAAVAAKFAESGAALDLQKKGWDINKIQEDIKIARQNANIAAMTASIAKEGNQIKREENQLKLQDMVQKRDSAVREKAADLESARSNMDNMLNTADRILKTPIGVISSATGPVSSELYTIRQDTADFEALVETLGSQSFLAQIPNIKGMGALSNTEGEKLQAAMQNFSLKQSPERLLENVKEAQRLIMKARKNMSARSGLPETIPDTPAVSTSGADVDALIKKYGGR